MNLTLEIHCPNPDCHSPFKQAISLQHTELVTKCPHCGEPLRVSYEVRPRVRWVQSEREDSELAPLVR